MESDAHAGHPATPWSPYVALGTPVPRPTATARDFSVATIGR